jgi:hypothetical protein
VSPNFKYYAYEGPNVQPNGEPYYANGRRGWDMNLSQYSGSGTFTICSSFDAYFSGNGAFLSRQYECGTTPAIAYVVNIVGGFRHRAYVQQFDNNRHTVPSVVLDFGGDTAAKAAPTYPGVPAALTQPATFREGLSRIDSLGLSCATLMVTDTKGGGFCAPSAVAALKGAAGIGNAGDEISAVALAPGGASTATLTQGAETRTAAVQDGMVVFRGIADSGGIISFDGVSSVAVPAAA